MRTARIALVCWLAFFGLGKARANFAIQTIQTNIAGAVTISWPAMPMWTYQVMYASLPNGPWQNFADGQITAGTNITTLSYTDATVAGVSQRYYKVSRSSAQLVMTLVLDTSGSMGMGLPLGSGGGAYLPGAVTAFIDNFNDCIDNVAMVSFATGPSNIVDGGSPPQPSHPFKAAITNAVNAFNYSGATFIQGGLTNALVLENNSTVTPPANLVKVVVLFTDGVANTMEATLNCPVPTTYIMGGNAPNEGNYIGFWLPSNPSGNGECGVEVPSSTTPITPSGCGCSATTFYSAITTSAVLITQAALVNDAQYRAVQVADAMRAAGIYVYCVGLGTGDPSLTFLEQIANDPSVPGYVPTPYDGAAFIANEPVQMTILFQLIAAKLQSSLAQ